MLWLLAAVVLPLIAFFWWAWRKRQELIAQFISSRLLSQLKVGVSATRQKARMAMIVIAFVFLIFALARPQWGVIEEEAFQRGLDIIVAIDTSNSMLAGDIEPSRLARAKLAALDLVRKAKTDRMGLIAFAGTAFLECPLTLDDAAFSQSVSALDTHTISEGGTAIAEAIDEARRAFKTESGNHKVLVLFTDGEDQDSEAVASAEKAADEGLIIFTVGIGTPEGERLRIRDERGQLSYLRDDQGQVVVSHLNEKLLNQIAQATKGFYLPLRGAGTMDTLYERGLAPLPKAENSARYFQRRQEHFHWPLAIAMALLIVEMFFPDRKRRRSRAALTASTGATALAETVALALLLALPLAAHAGSPGGALREYNQGDFQGALKDYDQLLEKKKDDPRLNFNAGAAAYQTQKMDEAVKQFQAAVGSPDLQLQQRAYYNLGNSFYRLGQNLDDNTKKQEAWENALKQYTNAVSLNTNDADAEFNLDYVRKQLEELKKQQDQKQSDKQNQQDQKQDPKQDQSKQDQKQDSQSQANQDPSKKDQDSQSQQKQDQSKSDQDKDKDKPDQSQAQNQQKHQDQKQKDREAQNNGAGQAKDQSKEDAQREAEMMAAGEMTPRQAEQLLDAQKDAEQVLQFSATNNGTSQGRALKNW